MEDSHAPAISRGQHTLFVLPDDPSSVAVYLAPALERLASLPADATGPVILIITADADRAAAVAAETLRFASAGTGVVAATAVGRTARVLGSAGPSIVIGPPDVILGLIGRSRLKLEHLRALIVAGADDILRVASGSLETVLADVPKDTPRTIVTSVETPEIEALVERYARRPRRVAPDATAPAAPASPTIQYVAVTHAGRLSALRHLLDDLDPPSAIVYVRTEQSATEIRATLEALGYRDGATVKLHRGAVTESSATLVLYDVPLDAQELASALGGAPVQVIALAERRELRRLKSLSASATPLTLSGTVDAAKRQIHALRDELRRTMDTGLSASEVLDLEPLLSSYEAIEIAAAALHLLRKQRLTPEPPPAPPQAPKRDWESKGERPRFPRSGPPRDRGPRDGPPRDRGPRRDGPPRDRGPRRP